MENKTPFTVRNEKRQYVYIDIESVRADILDRLYEPSVLGEFKNKTSLYNYIALHYAKSGDTAYTIYDLNRYLGLKEGNINDAAYLNLSKIFGFMLKNDEDFYISNIINPEVVSKLSDITNVDNYQKDIENLSDLILGFRKILRTLEYSSHFTFVPKTQVNGCDFYDDWLEKLAEGIYRITLGDSKLKDKLNLILKEIEIFMRSYEIPGVVERWKDINPKIVYFDVAYVFLNDYPNLYHKIKTGDQSIKLAHYPSDAMLEKRNEYFDSIDQDVSENNLKYSDKRIFTNELLVTLSRVIDQDLGIYL